MHRCFLKIWEPSRNSRCQKGDLKHAPYREPTIIRSHCTKFSRRVARHPGFVHHWGPYTISKIARNFIIAISFRLFLRFSQSPREIEISDVCIDKEAILRLPATLRPKNEFTVARSLK